MWILKKAGMKNCPHETHIGSEAGST